MTFLGDEGRDALMIKRILVEHDIPLIGPPTSVGNIYLGPLYYYMMAVPMAVFWLNPVAAAGMVALVGVLTVALIYFLAREWFGKVAAILAAFLYSISPITITYSRSSWNPNPAPFFTLIAMLSFYQARKTSNFLWLVFTGGAVAAATQMHYLALILIPVFIILWFFELLIFKKQKEFRNFVTGSIGAIVAFFIVTLPLIVFDFKHNFLNYRALNSLFFSSDDTIRSGFLIDLGKVWVLYQDKLVGRYIAAEAGWLSLLISILVLIPIVYLIKNRQMNDKNWPILALSVWLVVGLLGISLYKHDVYDHYLGFLSPVLYLLLAGIIVLLKPKWQVITAVILLLVVGFYNLQKNPLLFPPNNQLQRTQNIARFVISEAKGEPFNFALIAQSNYDAAYQFYLDRFGFKPKAVPVEITKQLFVVCEDAVCNPVGHSKYEIAAFGWTKIESQKEVEGVKIFKLVHNQEDPNYTLK